MNKATRQRQAALLPALRARPRLVFSMLFGLAVYAAVALFSPLSGAAAVLAAWNAGALLNLGLTWHMARETDVAAIKRRAVAMGQGRVAILSVVVLASGAALLAVGTQLIQVRHLEGGTRIAHLLLAVLTIVSAWFFVQAVFALQYAHDFYAARLAGAPDPLRFPGTPEPLYGDFFHFACVIGTSGQTADISFNGPALRPVGTVHCIISFFFNASLIALSINVAASVMV